MTPNGNINLLELAVSAITSRQPSIAALQIGAFDGEARDPLKNISCDERLDALLLEPQAEPITMLAARCTGSSRIRLENSALLDRTGPGTMYAPTRRGASPRASSSPDHKLRFGGSESHQFPVQLISIGDLLNKHAWLSCDVLQIDVEGLDLKILKLVLSAGLRPSIFNLEGLQLRPSDIAEVRQLAAEVAIATATGPAIASPFKAH